MPKYFIERQVRAALFIFAVAVQPALAQEATDVCLKTGETIHASSIDRRGAQYSIVPVGVSTALQIPADQVRTVGAACREADSAPATPPAPAATAQQASPPQTVQTTETGPTRFAIRGSSALGERLVPALIEAYAQKRGWKASVRETSEGGKEIELVAPGASLPEIVIDLKSGQAADAANALLDGSAAIGMSARRLTSDEAAQFAARFQIDPLAAASGSEHVVALDALAVVVHRDNPIKSLTLNQMARIFSGEIANWKDVRGLDYFGNEVSGPDLPVHVHAPAAGSENLDYLKQVVMGDTRGIAGNAARYNSGEMQSKAVNKDLGAIGFVELSYVRQNTGLNIATSCGLITTLSRFSIKTEEYLLTRRLYLYTVGESKQRKLHEFVQFSLSREAQIAINDIGIIDQSIEFQIEEDQKRWLTALENNKMIELAQPLPKKATKSNGKPIRSAEIEKELTKIKDGFNNDRTTFVFRFERNSSNLDARALQDVVKVQGFLNTEEDSLGRGKLSWICRCRWRLCL